MEEEIIVIGKVKGSTSDNVTIEYPSITGIKSIVFDRYIIARLERITEDRVAALIRPDDSDKANHIKALLLGDWSPLHVTEEHLSIVSALEHGEEIPTTKPIARRMGD